MPPSDMDQILDYHKKAFYKFYENKKHKTNNEEIDEQWLSFENFIRSLDKIIKIEDEIIDFIMDKGIAGFIKPQSAFDKKDPYDEQRKNSEEQKNSVENQEKKAIDEFNIISVKKNNDNIISEFEFRIEWKKVGVSDCKPAYWLIKSVSNRLFVFPNPVVISKSNYLDIYQECYNIDNISFAGEKGRHLIISKSCIVENGRPIQKGQGRID